MEVHITTRKELYDLVWTESITSLAEKHGIPYSNIIKACKDSIIPTPPVGYWQKLKYNKPVTRIKLIDSHVNPEIRISKAPKNSRNISLNDRVFNVPSKLVDPHPLIQQAKIVLNEARPYNDGVVSTGINTVSITVSKALIPRALKIMDTLFKCLNKIGYEIAVSHLTTFVVVNGQKIEISIREKQKRIANRDNRYLSMTELIPTGKLVFKYGEHSWCSKEVSDGKFTIEQQLQSIILRLEDESNRMRELKEEIRLRRLEFEEKRMKEFEIKEKEEADNKALQELIDESNIHHQANILKQYITNISNRIEDSEKELPHFKEWFSWANKKMSELDPISKRIMAILRL